MVDTVPQIETPMRVVFWGTYDLSKPRTRILRDGLRAIGVEVVEIRSDVWPQHADKSQLSKPVMFLALVKTLLSYPSLLYRYMRAPDHTAVIVPYLGQLDVLILWAFAKLRGRPVVWDMFISLYDTVVFDRKMVSRRSPAALLLKAVEWLGCRAAQCVLLDTDAHAARIAELFALPSGRTAAVPVGAEPESFTRQPASANRGPTRVLFYGQLIPLHGLETILEAALSDRGRAHQWHLIGKGQQQHLIEEALAQTDAPHIQWDKWVAYDTLAASIAQADISLGIFGASQKAASVVPNKLYQSVLAGRSVITRASPAMTQTFPKPQPGIKLVPHSDAEALLGAIDQLKAEQYPVVPLKDLRWAAPPQIAQALYSDVLLPLGQLTPRHV